VQECAALGVEPSDIRGGLRRLTAELPPLVGAAIQALQAEGITQGMAYYAAAAAAGRRQREEEEEEEEGGMPGQGGGPAAAAVEEELLPVLFELRQGRTAPPARQTAPPDQQQQGQRGEGGAGEGEAALEVDWDLGAALEAVEGSDSAAGDGGAPAAGISWELDASELAAGEADEGGDVGGEPAGAAAAPAEISWDIDISGAGADVETTGAAGAEGGAQPQAAAAEDRAAIGKEEPAAVARLVEDAAYRARLLDDLLELRAFLRQRQRELGGRGGELLLAGAAPTEALVGADAAGAMLAAVEAALTQLGGEALDWVGGGGALLVLVSYRSCPRPVWLLCFASHVPPLRPPASRAQTTS
jgi:hypothetical protein